MYLVHVLCVLQILLVGNCFISPLAGSAAAGLTDTGLAPAGQSELSAKRWPLGHRPLVDEQLTQVLCCVSPGFEGPGEGTVLCDTEHRQVMKQGPVRLLWAGAPISWGLPVTNTYSFNCPGTQ